MADFRFPGEWMKGDMVLGVHMRPESIAKLSTLDMSEGDVLIASYPKTGTTWLQELVWLVCNNGDTNQARSVPLLERVPFLDHELSGLTQLDKLSPPYVMKTHLRSETYRAQIEAGKVKIIIGIRNPKDTLVSFYHFYRMNRSLGNFQGTWNDFFELYKAKHLGYGDYFKWYSSWLQYKNKPNMMLVKYEDMHRRMPDVINEVTQFLGKSLSEDVNAEIIQHLSFDSMRCNDKVNYENFQSYDTKVSPFLRKGKIGDWKNYFSEEQSALVDKCYKDVIEPFGVTLEFE